MPSENRAPKSSNSSKPTKSKNDIAASAHKAKDAMSQNTTQAYGALMGCFGGEKKFNEVIQKYNPAFFDYAENVVLKSAPIEYKASKLFVTLGVIGMFQFAIPIVHWPLEVIAKFLQFSFLYTCGAKELRKGFSTSSSVNLVKSLLITFVVVVSLQTIPSLLFDIHYHFGALWHFCLPVLLLSLPSPQENDRTVAIFLCDVFLSSFLNTMTATMTGMLPEIDLQDDAQRVPALFAFSAFAISL
ncbi:hypothetical protein L198_05006 [Cryptococcus wingfieldii CBS 7118]|uniref:Uncharacterized protein n=1 Tax=Cryptococcus wingfieldii CBS 7118 TaxID=1295528 RepID=A0A1E3J1Z8_9TREE|nr:hypothetical protein L198_05006 [Cryptococcus wingfieldii CBS 7118]ODN94858.1 hypothetical protein L198_05006 [Cryptococcus wingfieldii CBS 7118]